MKSLVEECLDYYRKYGYILKEVGWIGFGNDQSSYHSYEKKIRARRPEL